MTSIIHVLIYTAIGFTGGILTALRIMQWAVKDLKENANAAIRNSHGAEEVVENARIHVKKVNAENGHLLNRAKELEFENDKLVVQLAITRRHPKPHKSADEERGWNY